MPTRERSAGERVAEFGRGGSGSIGSPQATTRIVGSCQPLYSCRLRSAGVPSGNARDGSRGAHLTTSMACCRHGDLREATRRAAPRGGRSPIPASMPTPFRGRRRPREELLQPPDPLAERDWVRLVRTLIATGRPGHGCTGIVAATREGVHCRSGTMACSRRSIAPLPEAVEAGSLRAAPSWGPQGPRSRLSLAAGGGGRSPGRGRSLASPPCVPSDGQLAPAVCQPLPPSPTGLPICVQ